MEKGILPFGFEVARILDCGFMIEEIVTPEPNNIDVGYGMNFVFDVQNSWIQYGIRADFRDKLSNTTFISGTVLTRFGIDNLSSFVNADNKIDFPAGSLEMLFSIAFSHMRAIVSKNVAGSRFTNIVVPIVKPNELFIELLNINIEKFSKFQERIGIKKQERTVVSDFQVKNMVFNKEEKKDIEDVELAPSANVKKTKSKKATH
jgi:hypothetical protein